MGAGDPRRQAAAESLNPVASDRVGPGKNFVRRARHARLDQHEAPRREGGHADRRGGGGGRGQRRPRYGIGNDLDRRDDVAGGDAGQRGEGPDRQAFVDRIRGIDGGSVEANQSGGGGNQVGAAVGGGGGAHVRSREARSENGSRFVFGDITGIEARDGQPRHARSEGGGDVSATDQPALAPADRANDHRVSEHRTCRVAGRDLAKGHDVRP